MKVFVAGATGAIGQPLIAELMRQGHTVTGMTRSEAGSQGLTKLGATVALVSACDAPAVAQALRASRAEVVIDQLTSLPKNPSEIAAALPGDRKLRIEGGGNLHRAALACGVRRYIQQSSGFFLRPGSGLVDESEEMVIDASPGVAFSARMSAELESRLLGSKDMEGVALRYGFFNSPNTWYCPEGACADQARRGKCRSSGKGKVCGRGCISRTRPSPRSLRWRLRPGSTTSSMTTLPRSASGFRRSRGASGRSRSSPDHRTGSA
jgi:nucleoside-diphosphate-sugar epimerase